MLLHAHMHSQGWGICRTHPPYAVGYGLRTLCQDKKVLNPTRALARA
jgi:hypothetical protein